MPGIFRDEIAIYSDIAQASRRANPQHIVDRIQTLPDLSKDGLEDAFREVFLGLLAELSIYDENFAQIWNILDTIFLLAKQKDAPCDSSLPYSFIEDLLDSQTIEGCSKVFDYLETRKAQMQPAKGQGMNQVMLRACNELLRRLSRAEDTILCGRIFIFMFQCIPLGHRSSVNLRGDFHVENVTIYDDLSTKAADVDTDMDVDDAQESGFQSSRLEGDGGESTETKIELDTLYPRFWSMQSYFASPTNLSAPAAMLNFRTSIEETLKTFKAVSSLPIKSSTTLPTDLDTTSRGTKRKRSSLSTTSHLTHSHASQTSAFNPKYLTNRDLFSLELHDVEFRRYILVQILIILDFLLLINSPEKKRLDELTNDPSKRPPNTSKNASVLYDDFKLTENDRTWIVDTRKEIEKHLEDDKLYLRMVNTVLSRDRNWAFWKAIGCPPITRDPVPAQLAAASQQTLDQLIANATTPLPPPNGARDLAFLSQHDSIETLRERKYTPPTLEAYYKSIQTDELNLDFAADEDEKKELQERITGKLWRALRSVPGKRFRLCEEIKCGENMAALVADTTEQNGKKQEQDEGAKEQDEQDQQDDDDDDDDVVKEEEEADEGQEEDKGEKDSQVGVIDEGTDTAMKTEEEAEAEAEGDGGGDEEEVKEEKEEEEYVAL